MACSWSPVTVSINAAHGSWHHSAGTSLPWLLASSFSNALPASTTSVLWDTASSSDIEVVTVNNSPAQPSLRASTTSIPTTTADTKKGWAYGDTMDLTTCVGNTNVGWAYNWSPFSNGSIPDGIEFVPMLWGMKDNATWSQAMTEALASGSRNVLSFNEPDLANTSTSVYIEPDRAAQLHAQIMNSWRGQVRIGSPAVSNAGPPAGLTWLENFLIACPKATCPVDFIPFHWYGTADVASFIQYIDQVASLANKYSIKNLWVTEFAANTGSNSIGFMSQALPYLESSVLIERYSYWWCADGSLLEGSQLSQLGQEYLSTGA